MTLFALGVVCLSVSLPKGVAHPVEQIFVRFGQAGESWEAEVLFDAAFALPEFRDDDTSPPPTRDWLVSLPDEEHARIREGATEFLRERLRFLQGDAELEWSMEFPDFEHSPPAFPKLLTGGAYTRVRLAGVLPRARGEIILELAEESGPNMVVAAGPESAPQYVTVSPSGRAALGVSGEGDIASDEASAAVEPDPPSEGSWRWYGIGFLLVVAWAQWAWRWSRKSRGFS